MKHTDGQEELIASVLRSSRTIAVIGASPTPTRRSHEVVTYLHRAGYDVIPVRPDRVPVADLATYAHLDDFGGSVDVVIIYRRMDAVVPHIHQAAAKRADVVWLPPGTWSREAGDEAEAHHLRLVRDRCIMIEHRHLTGATGDPTAGHPRKQAVHVRDRHRKADPSDGS